MVGCMQLMMVDTLWALMEKKLIAGMFFGIMYSIF